MIRLGIFLTIILLFISCNKQIEFNKSDWKSWIETESTPSTRWLMHKDLLKKYELKGVTKDSILNLLGNPNREYLDEFNYYLGYSGRGINTGTMTIIFENDSVIDVKVTDG